MPTTRPLSIDSLYTVFVSERRSFMKVTKKITELLTEYYETFKH